VFPAEPSEERKKVIGRKVQPTGRRRKRRAPVSTSSTSSSHETDRVGRALWHPGRGPAPCTPAAFRCPPCSPFVPAGPPHRRAARTGTDGEARPGMHLPAAGPQPPTNSAPQSIRPSCIPVPRDERPASRPAGATTTLHLPPPPRRRQAAAS
jgi:hypothetical protein